MFEWLQKLEHRARTFFVVVTVLIVIGVSVVDYVTSPAISFSAFYLFAVSLAAWFVGQRFAYFISLLSVAVSLAGDFASGSRYNNILVPFWNAFIVLAFYFVVVILLTRLRSATKGLEARVQERTTALTEEMAERERLERELLDISERERRRIGHDLHDSLGQHLTGTALAAQVLEEKLTVHGQQEASDAGKVVELIEEGIVLLRQLAKGLHPIELEAEGLMQALEELAATSSELLGISCRFECDSPVPVRDSATAAHLYRIAQEAVSNAVKHGKAKERVHSTGDAGQWRGAAR